MEPKGSRIGNATDGSSKKRKGSPVVTLRQNTSIQCKTPTLYVSNLHPRVTESHLELLFRSYGEITRVYFVRKRNAYPDGPGKVNMQDSHTVGYAFVEYKSIDSAKLAIEKIDGRSLLGRYLVVKPAHNKERPDGRVGVDRTTNTCEKHAVKSGDIKLIKKQRYDVENKIEAVKRAIEAARKKRRTDSK